MSLLLLFIIFSVHLLPLPRNPGLLISYTRFGQVDYRGTFFISDTKDDDFAGIVFGYQSNR